MKFKCQDVEHSNEGMGLAIIGIAAVTGLSIAVITAMISNYKDKKNPIRIIDRVLAAIEQSDKWFRDYPHVGDKDDQGKPYWVPVQQSFGIKDEWPKVETVASATKEQNRCSKLVSDIAKLKDTEAFVAYVNKVFANGFKMETIEETMSWPNGDWYNLKRTDRGQEFGPDTFRVAWVKWSQSLVSSLNAIKKNVTEIVSAKPSDNRQDMESRLVYLKVIYQFVRYVDAVVGMYASIAYELNMETPLVPADDMLADAPKEDEE